MSEAKDAPSTSSPLPNETEKTQVLEGVEGGGKAVVDDESWEPTDVLHELPKLEVTEPKGSFCQLDSRFSLALPPDDVYNIITDPNNRRVFKNIKEVLYRKVLEDDGNQQRVEVEQSARWRFLVFSGSFSSRLFVVQNRKNHTMDFELARQGMMKKFVGSWKIEPLYASEAKWAGGPFAAAAGNEEASGSQRERKNDGEDMTAAAEESAATKAGAGEEVKGEAGGEDPIVGSWVTLHQVVEPAFIPPWPFTKMVRNVSAKLVREILGDMQREAARIARLRMMDSKATIPDASGAEAREDSAEIKVPENPSGAGSSLAKSNEGVEGMKDKEDQNEVNFLSVQGLSLS